MQKNRVCSCLIVSFLIIVSGSLYGDLPGVTHSCLLQESSNIEAEFKIYGRVDSPRCEPDGGTIQPNQLVSLSSKTSGAEIYYTTDDSEPTTFSEQYTEPIDITGYTSPVTLKALAVKTGMADSVISTTVIGIEQTKVATPLIDLDSGKYPESQSLNLSCLTAGAAIYYTTDNSNPYSSSTRQEFTGITPIEISTDTNLRAIAEKSGLTVSDEAAESYVIDPYYRLHSIKLDISFTDLDQELNPTASGSDISTLTIDPHDETPPPYLYDPKSFTDFYDSGNPDALNNGKGKWEFNPTGSNGYITYFREGISGDGIYELEIINRPESNGYWDGTLENWILSIGPNTNGEGGISGDYELSELRITGYDLNGDEMNPQPEDLVITAVTPCNQPAAGKMVVSFLEDYYHQPDTGTIFGNDSFPLELQGDFTDDDNYSGDTTHTVLWDFDNDGIFGESSPSDCIYGDESLTDVTPVFDIGTHTVKLKVVDNHDVESNPVTKTLYVMPSDKLSFPSHIGVPYDHDPPEVDGNITEDTGWRAGYKFTTGLGTTPDMMFDCIRHNSQDFIYIGVRIPDNSNWTGGDTVVLGFGGTSVGGLEDRASNHTDDRLLYIYPAQDSIDKQIKIKVWDGEAWTAGTDIAAATTQFDFAKAGANVELKIPTTPEDDWLGVTDDAPFFAYARIDLEGQGVTDYSWPTSMTDTESIPDIDTHVFSRMWAGEGSISGAAVNNGLSLPSYSSIGVADPTEVSDVGNVNEDTTLLSKFLYIPNNDSGTPDDPSDDTWNNNDIKNILVAKVKNSTHRDVWDGSTLLKEMLTVDNVRVRFKIANWGIPGETEADWTNIDPLDETDPPPGNQFPPEPETRNPTEPKPLEPDPAFDNPDPGGAVIEGTGVFTLSWVLSEDQINQYQWEHTDEQGRHANHQCILVEIEGNPVSKDPTTGEILGKADIVIKSVHRNMNFYAENKKIIPFSREAIISAIGYGDPPPGETEHKILLRILTRTWEYTKADIEEINSNSKQKTRTGNPHYEETKQFILEADDSVAFIEYIVKGYLYTGIKAVVNGEKRDVYKPIGSYGHVVHHEGPSERWEFSIKGAEKINDTTYLIRIPPGERKTIIDHVEAVRPPEPPKWRIHAHGGAAFPINALASGNRVGPNFIVGAGYHLFPELGVNLLFGYNYLFPRPAGGTGNHLMSTVLQLRFSRELFPKLSFYAGIGPGLYFDTAGRFDAGLDIGLGFSFLLNRSLALEIGGDSHLMFPAKEIYLHAHAGVVARF